jgi:signal transduction histidine kinase
MLRLFLSLYVVLAVALGIFLLSLFFLPEKLFERHVYRHYERVAEGPLVLLREEFADRPRESWLQHVEALGQHYGYAFEMVRPGDLDLSEQALSDLKNGKPAVVDKHNQLDYILFPIDADDFVIGIGTEQPKYEHAKRLMGGFFHLVIKRLGTLPEDEWTSHVEDLGVQFYFPISLLDIDAVDLEPDDKRKLERGKVLGFDIDTNDERYLKRVDGTSRVLQIGPIPSPLIARIINYVVIGCLELIVAFAVFLWLRSLWRDMTMLDQSTVAFGRGELDTRLEVSPRSPVAGLANAFNRMAERIQQLIGSHEELTNAVSHELRTPIARMRFAIDMLEETRNQLDRRRYMENMRADIDELDSLVNELLGYARLDREKPELNLTEMPLAPWLSEIVGQTGRRETGIDLALESEPETQDLKASFEPRLMSRALSNVLRNALRHAKGSIRVRCAADATLVRIWIDDDGPGIPVGDRKRIFEPFTRLDTSRNRASGGHGLGLAIVKRIMDWHRGEVQVGDSPLGGARFCLTWPISGDRSFG